MVDIRVIEGLVPERPLGVELYLEAGDAAVCAELKVLSHSRPIPLSERVPVLENMGFRVVDERTYPHPAGGRGDLVRHDAGKRGPRFRSSPRSGDRLEACFLVVMSKKAESSSCCPLVLATGLGWRDVRR